MDRERAEGAERGLGGPGPELRVCRLVSRGLERGEE